MKKTYQAPAALIVNAAPIQMIAESLTLSPESANKDYEGGGDVKEETSPTLWGNQW